MTSPIRKALLLTAIAALATLALAPSAAADIALCPPGSGAGECSEPEGVATDFETGRVYVAERGNDRVSVFEADGDFVMAFGWDVDPDGGTGLETCTTATGCKAGSEGSGAGQLRNPEGIAVDNAAGSPGLHDVYVVTSDFRWQHFKPDGSFLGATGWGVDTGANTLETCTTASICQAGIGGGGECQLGRVGGLAIGPGGSVFIADNAGSEPNFTDRVQKFSPAGACLGQTVLIEGNARVTGLAIDSGEDAYVSVDGEGRELRKYDLGAPKTKLCDLDPGIGTGALAIDAADSLFASQGEPKAAAAGAHRVITEYDGPACKILHRFAYGQVQTNIPAGLAVLHGPAGDVWVSEGDAGGIHYLNQPPIGPIVVPESVQAGGIGNAKATIKAEANPEGKETGVRVEYTTDPEFNDEVKTTETKTLSAPVGKEFRVQFVEFPLGCAAASKEAIENGECLTPDTEYHYRVRATNADNPSGVGEGTVTKTFKTKEPFEIEDLFASEVGTDVATLSSVVNPLGIPATGHFEYVSDEDFKADVEGGGDGFEGPGTVKAPSEVEAEIDFGNGETGAKRSVVLFPLAPGITYHYRLAASDALIEGFRFSGVKTFRTFPVEGERPSCPNDAFRSGASAVLPDCRAYELVSPLDKANGDIVVLEQEPNLQPAVLNQSAVSGERLTYGSYRAFGDAKSAPTTSQYLASRNPLGHPEEGWQTRGISPLQTEPIRDGFAFDFEFRAFSEDLCEGWITPLFEPVLAEGGIAGVRNLYRRTELCDEEVEAYEAISTAAPEHPEPPEYLLELQGLSEDGTVAAFAGNDSLAESGAPPIPDETSQLYVKGPGQGPRYACVLPGGAPAAECSAGTGTPAGLGPMREANVTGALSGDGKRVFWTDSNKKGRIYLRDNPLAEGPECAEAGSPCTIAVSAEGEEESGTGTSHFWAAAKDGSAAIYTTGKEGKEDLYRFEVEAQTTSKLAGGVLGILGQSEDLSHVYFASTEALSGEEENSEGAKAQAGKANLYLHEAGPGPDTYSFIGVLAPQDANQLAAGSKVESSALSATPHHHNGRVSPDGLHAAFMAKAPLTGYDNADAKSGKADTEVFLYDAAANGGAGEILCASCNPSRARPAGADIGTLSAPFWVAGRLPVYSTTLYAPQVLSDDGSRLIFESQDPLVTRDTNSRIDVYEWEQPGTGGCEEGNVTFSPEAGGCVELISSGKSKRNSEIVDAGAGGNDVFFTTLSGLVPQDYGLIDIYDARVGGGFPALPPPEPECEGETCQNPPAAPELSTPASAAVGPGDPKAQKPKQAKKKKRKAKQRRRAKQHKARQRRHNQRRRAAR